MIPKIHARVCKVDHFTSSEDEVEGFGKVVMWPFGVIEGALGTVSQGWRDAHRGDKPTHARAEESLPFPFYPVCGGELINGV
jgi:hypothetical protein